MSQGSARVTDHPVLPSAVDFGGNLPALSSHQAHYLKETEFLLLLPLYLERFLKFVYGIS